MAQRIVPHKTSRPPRPVSLPRRRCSASSNLPFFFWRDKALIKEHARQIYRACEGRPRGPAEQQSWAIVSTRTAAATGARTVAEGSEACLRT